MNKIALIFLLSCRFVACTPGNENNGTEKPPVNKPETEVFDINIRDMAVRDPFIFVNKNDNSYYLHVNEMPAIAVYKSKDLKMWRKVGKSFVSNGAFWGTKDFWAPDVYLYNDLYYMFVTFSSDTRKRGTSILVADSITGPFEPLVNRAITPNDRTCLDGALYVDDDKNPWILFCREWIEVSDGEIYACHLSADLTALQGEPLLLFKASEAPWVGSIQSGSYIGNVTDAPFIYKAKNGDLLMLWSSFNKIGKYCIGVAKSDNGKITGKWRQMPNPLNNDDGGHAMIFKDLNGTSRISYHAPNTGGRIKIYEIDDMDGKLSIIQ